MDEELLKGDDILDDLDNAAEEELLRFSDDDDGLLDDSGTNNPGEAEYAYEDAHPELQDEVDNGANEDYEHAQIEDNLQLDSSQTTNLPQNDEEVPEVSSSGLDVSEGNKEYSDRTDNYNASSSIREDDDDEDEEEEEQEEIRRTRFRTERRNIITLSTHKGRINDIPDTLDAVITEEEYAKVNEFMNQQRDRRYRGQRGRGGFFPRPNNFPSQRPSQPRQVYPEQWDHPPPQQQRMPNHHPYRHRPHEFQDAPPPQHTYPGPPPEHQYHPEQQLPHQQHQHHHQEEQILANPAQDQAAPPSEDGQQQPRKILINPHFRGPRPSTPQDPQHGHYPTAQPAHIQAEPVYPPMTEPSPQYSQSYPVTQQAYPPYHQPSEPAQHYESGPPPPVHHSYPPAAPYSDPAIHSQSVPINHPPQHPPPYMPAVSDGWTPNGPPPPPPHQSPIHPPPPVQHQHHPHQYPAEGPPPTFDQGYRGPPVHQHPPTGPPPSGSHLPVAHQQPPLVHQQPFKPGHPPPHGPRHGYAPNPINPGNLGHMGPPPNHPPPFNGLHEFNPVHGPPPPAHLHGFHPSPQHGPTPTDIFEEYYYDQADPQYFPQEQMGPGAFPENHFEASYHYPQSEYNYGQPNRRDHPPPQTTMRNFQNNRAGNRTSEFQRNQGRHFYKRPANEQQFTSTNMKQARAENRMAQQKNIKEVPIVDTSRMLINQPIKQALPAEDEDEETKELRIKLEEQKRKREEFLRLKEERRKGMAAQRMQELKERMSKQQADGTLKNPDTILATAQPVENQGTKRKLGNPVQQGVLTAKKKIALAGNQSSPQPVQVNPAMRVRPNLNVRQRLGQAGGAILNHPLAPNVGPVFPPPKNFVPNVPVHGIRPQLPATPNVNRGGPALRGASVRGRGGTPARGMPANRGVVQAVRGTPPNRGIRGKTQGRGRASTRDQPSVVTVPSRGQPASRVTPTRGQPSRGVVQRGRGTSPVSRGAAVLARGGVTTSRGSPGSRGIPGRGSPRGRGIPIGRAGLPAGQAVTVAILGTGNAANVQATKTNTMQVTPTRQVVTPGGTKRTVQVVSSDTSANPTNRLVRPPQAGSRNVLVSNLSASTNEAQLRQLCRGLDIIENIVIKKAERKAEITFKQPTHAVQFQKKFQRHMLDLSMIQVTMIP